MKDYKTISRVIIYSPILFIIISISVIGFLIQDSIHFYYTAFVGLILLVIVYLISRSISENIHEYQENIGLKAKELDEKNRLLKDMLYIDSLTKLPNKKLLLEELSSMEAPKIIILDIDSFRNINEYYGSEVGDFILLDLKKELEKIIKNTEMKLYRLGADEFALVEDESLDVEKYEDLAQGLVDLFKAKEIEIPSIDTSIEINSTIGLSLDSEDTLTKAYIALNHAKNTQRDYVCYIKTLDTKDTYAKQVKWSNFIKEAIAKDQVVPFFQPIFDREGKVNKYECLARIINDKEEAISPGMFMETSKNVRQYANIAKVLIQKAFKMIAQTDKSVSINLLARDMSDSDVSNYVVDKIKEYGVAKQVVLEILEDENIENLGRIETFLSRVRRMGVRIAIDDFGTGYSNFSYLLKLKPDYIKIDGSLIKSLDTDTNSLAIVSAIIVFAKKLGIKTIAEFVHKKEIYEKCKELGIDEFQGFYLGEPSSSLYKN